MVVRRRRSGVGFDRSGGRFASDVYGGGYYILGDRLDEADETKLIMDAGPLGFLSIAAHGHADCLSLLLSVSGKELLVDPGTYCYHTEREWRDYFRGTAAHNTVRVDGIDQSQIAGAFLGPRKRKPVSKDSRLRRHGIACAPGTRAIGVSLTRSRTSAK